MANKDTICSKANKGDKKVNTAVVSVAVSNDNRVTLLDSFCHDSKSASKKISSKDKVLSEGEKAFLDLTKEEMKTLLSLLDSKD